MKKHRRNRPMGPVGRAPSNFGDHEDQVYLVASNFCNWLSFFRWALWQAYSAFQTSLLNLRGEGKKSREGNG